MILSQFYTAILERLTAKEVPMEYFDLWFDQISRNADEDDSLFFNYPAIFIEMQPIQWESLGRKKKHGELRFNLIVASEVPHETANIESVEERSLGLEHLTLLDNVFAALEGFNKTFPEGSGIGTISKTGNSFDHQSGGGLILAHGIPFKCMLTDVAATVPYIKRNPAFCNTPEINTGENI